jgi:hypothetical protein
MVRPAIPGTADRGPGATVLSALSCRRAFHAAARTWALDAIVDGTLTIVEITNDASATRACAETHRRLRTPAAPDHLGYSESTLEKKRITGDGAPFIKARPRDRVRYPRP